jgi:hypothetical protein
MIDAMVWQIRGTTGHEIQSGFERTVMEAGHFAQLTPQVARGIPSPSIYAGRICKRQWPGTLHRPLTMRPDVLTFS